MYLTLEACKCSDAADWSHLLSTMASAYPHTQMLMPDKKKKKSRNIFLDEWMDGRKDLVTGESQPTDLDRCASPDWTCDWELTVINHLVGAMAHWHDDSDLGQRPLIKLAWVLYHSPPSPRPIQRAHQSAECLAGLHHCITLTVKHACGLKCKQIEVGCCPEQRQCTALMQRWQKAKKNSHASMI